MLNFGSYREKVFSPKPTLRQLLLLAAFIAVCMAIYYITFELSASHIVASLISLLAFLAMCGTAVAYTYLSNTLKLRDANKKTILLFSHDDELAGQLRYLLPEHNTSLLLVRTYDSAIEILNKTNSQAFIIDTDNKPKNAATLVEMCRCREHNLGRLPIIAVQNKTTAKIKYQLLLEGFDDCLTKPVKKREFDGFYQRWINQSEGNTLSLTDEETLEQKAPVAATPEINTNTIESPAPIQKSHTVVDTKLALAQSHQSYTLAKDMLSLLINMINDSKENLLAYYKEKQWHELGELTHKIKGGCYCSGVPSLQDAVETIDKALEKEQHEQLEPQFEKMMTEIEHLLQWNEDFDIEVIFEEA